MLSPGLADVYTWARGQMGQPVLLDYVMEKVNGQTPGHVLLLLRQPSSRVPNVELEVSYSTERQLYQVVFSLLPFHAGVTRPDYIRPTFETPQGVIRWIKTGRGLA